MRYLHQTAILLACVAVLMMAPIGYAQNTAVIAGGPHDLSTGSALRNSNSTIDGQTCVFCHVPHGGNNNIPLWNRGLPTGAAYQLYTSSTSTTTETVAGLTSGTSGACMSCHDGTIGVDVLTNVNGAAFAAQVAFTRQSATAKATYGNVGSGSNNLMSGGLPFIGSDLRNDHPVGVTYETARLAKTTEFVTPTVNNQKITVGTLGLPLYGAAVGTATVECASCHGSHNNSLGNFLRVANTNSQMCLACHIK